MADIPRHLYELYYAVILGVIPYECWENAWYKEFPQDPNAPKPPDIVDRLI